MLTPIKLVVAGDFGAQTDVSGLHCLKAGGLDDLFGQLRPVIELRDGKKVELSTLDDFAPANLTKQLELGANAGQALTSVLHDERFQAVESAWRALAMLAEKLPDSGVLVEVLHTPFAQLRRRVLDHVIKPEHAGETAVPATALFVNFEFLPYGETFDVLQDLAKMGEAVKVPVMGQTTAGFFGIKHLLHLSALETSAAAVLARPALAAYRAFRETDASFWASLMLNRFLLRMPHEDDDYREPHSASDPRSYLWGSGIFLLAANLISSFSGKGHLVGLSGLGTGGEQRALATRVLPMTRTTSVHTPLEACLPLDMTESLPYLGLSPIAQLPEELGGQNQPDTVYVHLAANLHRMKDPQDQRIGLLTVHASLAYSLTLGRVANLAWRHLRSLEEMPPEKTAVRLAELLREDLWHKEDTEIEVTSRGEGVFSVEYAPHLLIHSKSFSVELEICA